MRISLFQLDLHWENPAANRANIDRHMDALGDTDLIVLPEMFTTGFSMRPERWAETPDGATIRWMQKRAKQLDCAICGSIIFQDTDVYHNRLLWVAPDGSIQHYDKRHLFALGQEQVYYTAGQERLIVQWRGWRICPLICYDLRFPVWSRNTVDYDLLLYVANWPMSRRTAWQQLLIARAIENQSYCAGVNRVGTDGSTHMLDHSGDSCLVDYTGKVTWHCSGQEAVQTLSLDQEALYRFREKLPFLKDRDEFSM